MYSALLTIALLVAPALADFAISSPKQLKQCEDVDLSWEKTQGPYNVIIVDAANPCGDAVQDLGDFTGSVATSKVKVRAGTKVQFSAEDANGDEAWSAVLTVEPSDDDSCLPADVKPASSSVKVSSTSSVALGSTVVVTPTTTVDVVAPQSTDTDGTPDPVGAAGAGPLSQNAAITARQASTPLLIITALAAAMALSL